jgi:hypothetical protein
MNKAIFSAAGLTALSSLLTLSALTACSHSSRNGAPGNSPAAQPQQQARATAAKKIDEDRQELDQIPPPSKNRYMGIHTVQSWSNPFLTVGRTTVTLRVLYPEPGGSDITPGNLLRPTSARKRQLELRLSDLPEALSALPENLWPYGRVIAVEEDQTVPRAERPQVRRNVEATMQMLSDLGVVAYEWPVGGPLR